MPSQDKNVELARLRAENLSLRAIAEPILSVAREYIARRNDGTAAPLWIVCRKTKRGEIIFEVGPYFSRERAERFLHAKRHDYPKSIVYCISGHYSRIYTNAVESAIVFLEEQE